ncbi:hypothetical protein [Streptomyces specialis]|uniref:hypothetical protein n=1 Tax=Streptomyces specialis TaxID=498367 RepID=UPI00073E5113|nr:hypothetical protein [Streptomyces specialis]
MTTGHLRLLAHDRAAETLPFAISEASRLRLPHQLQRVQRASTGRLPDIHTVAEHALDRLRAEMAT